MRRVARVLGAAVLIVVPLLLTGHPAGAQFTVTCTPPTPEVDFLTGGGFILLPDATNNNLVVHANFGVAGGCKAGEDGHGPLWGHLEYIDHGSTLTGGAMLTVHWTTITLYLADTGDPRARLICGTATTNLYGDVLFGVRAADDDSSATPTPDKFDIQLTTMAGGILYTTFTLVVGGHSLEGGNIVLHPPNQSITGTFTESCLALGIF